MLAPGTNVERYRVERLLGRGGLASVYAVRHTLLGTRHALKVLHSGDAAIRERLVREGRLQARLDPAHVVAVIDVLEVAGAPALLMHLVEGCSLADVIEAHRPSPAEAAALFAGVLAGIRSAHAAGVVHRDLKPANVLLEVKRGRVKVKVADFGLARPTERDHAETRANLFMGTPAYAAPEQIDAANADHRADLWSLGVIGYELLTGARPFVSESLLGLFAAVQRADYDPTRLPEAWRPVIGRLLLANPAERFQSADEVLAAFPESVDLGTLVEGQPIAEAVRARVAADAARAAESAAVRTGITVALDDDASALHSRGNLPTERDAFVGREDELAALSARLDEGAAVVTVVGLGGTGKTRLSLRLAWQRRGDWHGGAWFCDLSEARDVDGIARAVAAGLDLSVGAGDAIAQLGKAMAVRGPCLVLLDNFEQVSRHAPATLGRWIDLAPDATFLVTSRELLGVRGEVAFPLAPLDPADSIALFHARARAAIGRFDPGPEDAAAVEALVALLDHLPLAIELAAARVRVLPPRALLARMSDRFKLLRSSSARSERQATLKAALDWSWELLVEWERSALAQLAVFEGGFDLEAAEEVVDLSAHDDAPWVLDAVQSLVDKSLIRPLGRGRFDLLVSVHEYAAGRLDERGERSGAEERHGRFFAELGSEAAILALDREDGELQRRLLRLDLDDLLVANRRAVGRGDVGLAVRTAAAAWAGINRAAPVPMAVSVLEATLAMPGIAGADAHRIRDLLGYTLWTAGRNEEARPHYDRALADARTSGDPRRVSLALARLGYFARYGGDVDAGYRLLDEARALAVEAGDRLQEARLVGGLAEIDEFQGRLDAASAKLAAAREGFKATGNLRSEAHLLALIGNLEFHRGRLAAAQTAYEASIVAYRRVGDRRMAVWVETNLAGAHAGQGDVVTARRLYQSALAVQLELGDRRSASSALCNLGALEAQMGLVAEARVRFGEAVAMCREVGDKQFEAISLGNLANLDRDAGDVAAAEAGYAAAIPMLRALGDGWTAAAFEGERALAWARAGRLTEAREGIVAAIAEMQGEGAEEGLALLYANEAEIAWLDGRPDDARAALGRAEARAAGMAAGEGSPTDLRIRQVAGLIDAR